MKILYASGHDVRVDDDVFEKYQDLQWFTSRNGAGKLIAVHKDEHGRLHSLHRLIKSARRCDVVTFKDGNSFNCQRSNLKVKRGLTPQQAEEARAKAIGAVMELHVDGTRARIVLVDAGTSTNAGEIRQSRTGRWIGYGPDGTPRYYDSPAPAAMDTLNGQQKQRVGLTRVIHASEAVTA